MAKSDKIKLEEIAYKTEKLVRMCDLAKTFLHGVVILGLGASAAWVMVTALKVPGENVSALANCLKAVHLNDIIKYVAIAICGGGWYFEKRRNNRLVRKEGELRHQKERNDPVNPRSGLDEVGATPKGGCKV